MDLVDCEEVEDARTDEPRDLHGPVLRDNVQLVDVFVVLADQQNQEEYGEKSTRGWENKHSALLFVD